MKQGIADRISTAATAVVLLLFVAALFTKCASTMTPTGGPKDTLPPVIVAMTPDNFSTEFPRVNHPKIYVEFDEYVQIKDQQKEFFTSPAMKKKPTLTRRGKGVVITLKDTLQENTTYALNFGSSIQDNNEGNPLHSMRYVFSTGTEIDSMYMSGYTADSYKADSVGKTFIWFFIADSVPEPSQWDSTMFNHKPAVIARAENNGIFIAQNLKPVPYRVYAFEDTNNNMEYEPSVDRIGFIEGTYNPAEMPEFSIWFDSLRHYPSADPQLYFRMFTDRKFARHTLTQSERPNRHQAMLYFGAPQPQIVSIDFDSIPRDRVIIDPQSRGRDTLALWFDMPGDELPDTIKGSITYMKHDSINNLVETTDMLRLSWRKVETKEEEKERERLEKEREKALKAGEEWIEPEQPNPFAYKLAAKGEVNPLKNLDMTLDYPLVEFDSLSVTLTSKRTGGEETPRNRTVRLLRDTLNSRLWHIESDWTVGDEYTLTIPSGAMRNVAGESNDSIIGQYTVADPDKYATVKINVRTSKPDMRYIVQLTNSSGSVQQQLRDVTAGTYEFKYVAVGEVMVRVIEDANANGEWDTGDMVLMRQPERTEIYKNSNGEEVFTTKANWEFEFDIDMDDVFKPVTMQSVIDMLEDREQARLKKLAEEQAKKNKENEKKDDHNHGSGFGFGGMSGSMRAGINATGQQR
ncbi:MAG: Ig-like domain-containing protein [Alistipes sp.]|nr:Ig-like domain-containing protein [Alistipes sp.]